VIPNLTPGTTYYARVSAINARGLSMYTPTTPTLSFIPKDVPGPVVTDEALTAVTVRPYTGTSLKVS
jgi:hypothetical protein